MPFVKIPFLRQRLLFVSILYETIGIYTDSKPVREACGTAYLAVLIAIDNYLIKSGVSEDKLPQSIDGYRKALRKYLAIHNGKLTKNFERIYRELHIAGYYRGLLFGTDTVRDAINAARDFIEKIEH